MCVVVLRPPQELHSTISHEIPSSGERCFRQEQSGDYTVAVFKQNMNKTLHAFPLHVYMASISLTTCKSKEYVYHLASSLLKMGCYITPQAKDATPSQSLKKLQREVLITRKV